MIPIATIHHWDLPQRLEDDFGGWLSPKLVEHFVNYARIVIKNLEEVQYWITINEPKQICIRGYGDGSFAPGKNTTGINEYLCAYTIAKCHAATYHMYKKEFPHYKGKKDMHIITLYFGKGWTVFINQYTVEPLLYEGRV